MNPIRSIALIDDLRAEPAERPWCEFKVNNYAPEVMGKRISALSNSARLWDRHCGYMVWGIEDLTHNVVGTEFEPATAMASGQPLEMWLSKRLDPCPHLAFRVVAHPEGRVVLLEIPAATHAPVKYDRIPYIRLGSATPPLTDYADREKALWDKLRPYAWEAGVAMQFVTSDTVLQGLDYPAYFALTRQPLPDNREGILARLEDDRLISKDVGGRWNILNMGAILFARNLREFELLDRKAVRLVQYAGRDQSQIRRKQDGQRGYASGYEELIDLIGIIVQGGEPIGPALRTKQLEYPEIAIRELVANALIHQDMTITGAGPLIEIFSDRIEITNPGAPLIEARRIIDMPPRSRNQDIASLMRRMGICEEQGSGLNRVVSAIEDLRLPPPDWRVDGDNSKFCLFAKRTITPDERLRAAYQHSVLRWLAGGRLTNASLGDRLGIDKKNASMVTRVINAARKQDLIRPAELDSPRAGYVPIWA
jgi:ATP-dependent DNA helicase RecG